MGNKPTQAVRRNRGKIEPNELNQEIGPQTEIENTPGGSEENPGEINPGDPNEITGPEDRQETDEITVVSTPGRKTSTQKVQNWRARKKQENGAKDSALILITMINGLVSVAIGPDATMNKIEQTMIEEPLTRIIQRSGFQASEMISKYTDPILLVMGLVAWGSRVTRLQSAKHANQPPKPQPVNPEVNQEPPNPVEISLPGEPMDIGEMTGAPAFITNQLTPMGLGL